jgi:hypothetical protein
LAAQRVVIELVRFEEGEVVFLAGASRHTVRRGQ